MADPAFLYIVTVLTVGAFLIGFAISWQLKDVYDNWMHRKDYTQAVLHPELYDNEGNLSDEEMIYLRFPEEDDILYDENED
tara:strand:+ start:103 stop:345 length:243 start_codon:yes stop_codon:yes gene_type:complete